MAHDEIEKECTGCSTDVNKEFLGLSDLLKKNETKTGIDCNRRNILFGRIFVHIKCVQKY